jgi:hypothetical protein
MTVLPNPAGAVDAPIACLFGVARGLHLVTSRGSHPCYVYYIFIFV